MISTVIHGCWQPASFCPALVLLPAWWPLTPQPPHCKSTASTASDPGHAFSTTGSFSNRTYFVRVFTVPPTSHAIHFTSGLKIWLSKRLIWLLCALLMGLSCFREEEWTQEVEKLKWERERIKHRRMRVPSRSRCVCMLAEGGAARRQICRPIFLLKCLWGKRHLGLGEFSWKTITNHPAAPFSIPSTSFPLL